MEDKLIRELLKRVTFLGIHPAPDQQGWYQTGSSKIALIDDRGEELRVATWHQDNSHIDIISLYGETNVGLGGYRIIEEIMAPCPIPT